MRIRHELYGNRFFKILNYAWDADSSVGDQGLNGPLWLTLQ